MLDLGPQAGFAALLAPHLFAITSVANCFNLRSLGSDEERRFAVGQLRSPVYTGIAAVAEYAVFLAVQQLMDDGHVAHIGSSALHVVYQAGKLIYADVCLHAEVPLVAFAGLVHFKITPPPPDFRQASSMTMSNAWGGAVTVSPATVRLAGDAFTVGLSGLPARACVPFVSAVAAVAGDANVRDVIVGNTSVLLGSGGTLDVPGLGLACGAD